MILFGIYPSLSKCLEDKCYKFDDFNSNYKSKVSPKNSIHQFSKKTKINSFRDTEILGKFYLRDNLRVEKLLASLTRNINKEENQIINKKQFVDIQSNSITNTSNKYIAEGNVRALTPYGIFYADKISYDFEKEIFVAEGNISFIKNNQYLEASKLEYDFLNKKGYIDNLYGIVNLRKFNKDINDKEYNYENLVEENIISEISNPRYLDASKLSFANDYDFREEEEDDEEEDEDEDINDVEKLAPFFKETKLSADIESISRWRLKTNKLLLNNGIFTSEKIFFTNDIYNKPQLIIKTIDLEGELVDESIDLTGRRNYFIFDDKFTLPVGRRRISATNSGTWGIASDTEEKDGFYIFRTLDEIELPLEYKLNLTPQYLLQRSLQGHTDSFRPSNSTIFDDNVESDNSVYDLFGLDATLKGKIFSWDLKIYSQLNSLDLDRFEQAYRSKITLSKTIDLISYRYLQKKKIKENKRIRANIKKLLNQNVCLKDKEYKNIDQLKKERDELIIARAYLDNSMQSIEESKRLSKEINFIQGQIIKENQLIRKLENTETTFEDEVKQLLNQNVCLKEKEPKNIDQLEKERDELIIARAYLDNSMESMEESKRLSKEINLVQDKIIKEKEKIINLEGDQKNIYQLKKERDALIIERNNLVNVTLVNREEYQRLSKEINFIQSQIIKEKEKIINLEGEQKNIDQLEKERDELIIERNNLVNVTLINREEFQRLNKEFNLVNAQIIGEKKKPKKKKPKKKKPKCLYELEKKRDELIIARAYLDNSMASKEESKRLSKEINLVQDKIIKEKENKITRKLENTETTFEAEVKQLLNQNGCLKEKEQKNIDQLEKERDELIIARAYLDNSMASKEESKRLSKEINFIQGQIIKGKENQKFIENKIDKLIPQKNYYEELRKLDSKNKKDRKMKLIKDEVTFEVYKSYREKVDKGFSGEKNIYKGKGVRIENKKTLKNKKNRQYDLNLNFDLGIFEAKRNGKKELIKARRLFKNIGLSYKQPLIIPKYPELLISEENIYSPKVISQGLYWVSDIDAGIFVYEDHNTQRVLKLSSGPEITFGKFKSNILDYTKVIFKREHVFKSGESIFDFDDESVMPRYKLKFEQQLIGPLLFTFSSYINLEEEEDAIYGEFKSVKYGMEIRRRAYSISIYAKPDVDSNFDSGTYGFNFNIFNFDYSGISPKF